MDGLLPIRTNLPPKPDSATIPVVHYSPLQEGSRVMGTVSLYPR
jgi:hypothetical protein